ncbi:FliC/FljB family flagellin [Halomonas sp. H33-56]|uniref:Flagellin n=1 Tax=Halomonas sp. RT37 TaxID=2950872 RepID=A0AAU7KH12_9GAMM|nr:FliC/FljB family flagellin [Halomonas sp. DP5N14-9]MBY5940634.1 FliC/FljB family flagellin [Halomonas sp. DP5N14-9]
MSVINTNITSMIGQQNLNASKSALTTSMERLSSGLRINSAKDDAAGQAIANRMSSQITGLSQAQRNANDGISVAQTAEGALNQVNDNLQRVRELTVQAQNGTNSTEDKQSIQDEINQRLDEIDRISEETDFNGVKVLASTQNLSIQVGANDGENISVNLEKTDRASLGLDGFNVSALSGPITEITSTSAGGVETTTPVDFSGLGALTASGGALDGQSLTLRGYGDFDADAGTYANYAIEDDNGNLYKLDATGTAADDIAFDASAGTFAIGANIDATDSADLDSLATAYDDDVAAGLSSTANPLGTIDSALKMVDEQRSELGAIQNRFESAITNLSTTETNLSAARSRIEDADYAVEVANMTRAQILQQAGTSVLAQANQVPQSVLSLLG